MLLEEGRLAVLGSYFDVESSQEYRKLTQQISLIENGGIPLMKQNKTIRINVRSRSELDYSLDFSRLHNERLSLTSQVASVYKTENSYKLQGILSLLLAYIDYLWYGVGMFGILALLVLYILRRNYPGARDAPFGV